jgi:hypothetical protein
LIRNQITKIACPPSDTAKNLMASAYANIGCHNSIGARLPRQRQTKNVGWANSLPFAHAGGYRRLPRGHRLRAHPTLLGARCQNQAGERLSKRRQTKNVGRTNGLIVCPRSKLSALNQNLKCFPICEPIGFKIIEIGRRD